MNTVLMIFTILVCIGTYAKSEEIQKNQKWQIENLTTQLYETEKFEPQIKIDRSYNRIILISTLVIVIMFIGIVFGLINRYRFIKKTKVILTDKNRSLNKLVNELSESNREKEYFLKILNDEANKAYTYVISLLSPPIRKGDIRVNWKFVPSSTLGGDSLGYQWLSEKCFSFFILDVSGHGLEPAIHAVSIFNILRNKSLPDTDFTKPGEVITSLNKIFQMNEYNNLYFTIVYAVYCNADRTLTYCNAGHPPPIVISDNSTHFLEKSNFIIGGKKEFDYQCASLTVPEKASVYLYSDGVYEVEKNDDNMITTEEMASFLLEKNSPNDTEIEEWFSNIKLLDKNEVLSDDFSMMKISID